MFSPQDNNFVTMYVGMDINWTYCGGYFAIYTNIKSLCHSPKTNITLYVNDISVFKNPT